MGGTINQQRRGLPFIGFLLLPLAACGQLGGGQTSQLGDSAGTGPSTGVMNVADAAIAGGDPEMALKVSQSVLTADPTNLDALYHEGEAYYAINRCMDAIAVYKVALTVDPKSSDAELGIGRCLLKRNAAEAEIACAESGGQAHPVVGLWPVRLAPLLRRALEVEDVRRIDRWTVRFALARVAFPTDPFDPFFNVNTPEDLAAAEAWLR